MSELIHPVTIVGTHYVMPKKRFSINPGTVTVIFHEPIEPKDFGVERAALDGLSGGDAEASAAIIRSVLSGARLACIRPETDKQAGGRVLASRDIPRHVKRAVSRRDDGQCGFVAHDGQRCEERTFLEFHHLQPYALGGPASVENISLRCAATTNTRRN